jgi:hypothetical protein
MQTNDPREKNHAIRHNGSLETERAFLSYSKEGRRDTALTVAAFDYPPTSTPCCGLRSPDSKTGTLMRWGCRSRRSGRHGRTGLSGTRASSTKP